MHNGNPAAKKLFKTSAVGLKGDSARDKEIEVRKNLTHRRFAANLEKALKVHLHPGRNARNERHGGVQGLANHGFNFLLPVFDAVCLPRGLAVFLKVGGHKVCGNSAQSAGRDSVFVFEHGAALQKDHAAVDHFAAAGGAHVGKEGVACRGDVVGHGLFSQGNVLGPGGGSAGFGKVGRPSGPKNVGFARNHAVDVGP